MKIYKITSFVLLSIFVANIICFAKEIVPKISSEQQEKIDYVILQENSKLLNLNKNFQIQTKLLHIELCKPSCNMDIVNSLRLELSTTASDIEKVKFDAQCAIRSILSSQQYKKYYKQILKKRIK